MQLREIQIYQNISENSKLEEKSIKRLSKEIVALLLASELTIESLKTKIFSYFFTFLRDDNIPEIISKVIMRKEFHNLAIGLLMHNHKILDTRLFYELQVEIKEKYNILREKAGVIYRKTNFQISSVYKIK